MNAPTRPVLRWHGGKWKLAPWVISHMPRHRVYVEPFGGAASVLLRKERSFIEIWNDLDGDLFNLFRVLQEPPAAQQLVAALSVTPYSRAEFALSFDAAENPIERARRMIVRSFMGFGSNACATTGRGSNTTGFRARSEHPRKQPSHEWGTYADALPLIIERIRGVVIEGRDAIRVMRDRDGVDVVHYVDPPYLPETRERGSSRDRPGRYRHEMDAPGHAELIDALTGLAGMVVLSGYPSKLYDTALPDWRRVTTKAHADGARERTEVLWLNPACAAALDRERAGHGTPLFPSSLECLNDGRSNSQAQALT